MLATRFKFFSDVELIEIGSGLISQSLIEELSREQEHRALGVAQYRDVESYYFGTVHQAGHYLWTSRLGKAPGFPYYDYLPWKKIDGSLVPGHSSYIEGRANLHHKDGWTAISFNDRSVDSRGGSNSNFFFKAPDLTFPVALALAKLTYPSIFKRFKFEVVHEL